METYSEKVHGQWRSSPQILGGAELHFRLNQSMDEYLLSRPPNRALPHHSKTSRFFFVLAAAGASTLPDIRGRAKQSACPYFIIAATAPLHEIIIIMQCSRKLLGVGKRPRQPHQHQA